MKARVPCPIPAIIQDQCHVGQVRGVAASILGGDDGDRKGWVWVCVPCFWSKEQEGKDAREKKNIENDASFGLIHKTQRKENGNGGAGQRDTLVLGLVLGLGNEEKTGCGMTEGRQGRGESFMC